MGNGSMKNQLKTIGLSLMLAVLPVLATTVSAQWQQQNQDAGVVANINDTIPQPAFERFSDAAPVNTITLSEDGTLFGQVGALDANTGSATGLEGLKVFFVQNGKVIRQAQTEADGSFQIQGIPDGAYSFYAAGKAGFAASGIYVTGQDWAEGNSVLEATVASPNYIGIQRYLQYNVPSQIRQAMTSAGSATSTGPIISSSSKIRLANGRLNGQINSLFGQTQNLSRVQINLIQNDRPIAQVQTDSDGQFSIPDIEPGVYDFVAANNSAMVVGRFEAIKNNSVMTRVSFRKIAMKLEFALTETRARQPDEDPIVDEAGSATFADPGTIEYVGESIGYGGAAGGSAGNVGYVGGGGGVGMRRLLILGGLGVGIAALADDNPTPASPVQ